MGKYEARVSVWMITAEISCLLCVSTNIHLQFNLACSDKPLNHPLLLFYVYECTHIFYLVNSDGSSWSTSCKNHHFCSRFEGQLGVLVLTGQYHSPQTLQPRAQSPGKSFQARNCCTVEGMLNMSQHHSHSNMPISRWCDWLDGWSGMRKKFSLLNRVHRKTWSNLHSTK